MVIFLCGCDKSSQDGDIKEAKRIAAYLEAAFEEDDAALITAAIGDVARSKGMTEIAKRTGLSRKSLYKALSDGGNPAFGMILKVFASLSLCLEAKPMEKV